MHGPTTDAHGDSRTFAPAIHTSEARFARLRQSLVGQPVLGVDPREQPFANFSMSSRRSQRRQFECEHRQPMIEIFAKPPVDHSER